MHCLVGLSVCLVGLSAECLVGLLAMEHLWMHPDLGLDNPMRMHVLLLDEPPKFQLQLLHHFFPSSTPAFAQPPEIVRHQPYRGYFP